MNNSNPVGLPASPRSKPKSPPPSRPSSTLRTQHSRPATPSYDHDGSRDSLSSFATSYDPHRVEELDSPPVRTTSSTSSTARALSITTSFPYARSSPPPPDAPELLPTYVDLQSAEPANPRFGRWRGWIEKRATERREERDTARSEGRTRQSGWDLSDASAHEKEYWESGENDAGRERNEAAERRLSRRRPLVTNPDGGESSPAPSTSSSMLHAGHGVLPLSVGTSVRLDDHCGIRRTELMRRPFFQIHPLGSRFLQQVPEQPRCGVVLPVGGKSAEGVNLDRCVFHSWVPRAEMQLLIAIVAFLPADLCLSVPPKVRPYLFF